MNTLTRIPSLYFNDTGHGIILDGTHVSCINSVLPKLLTAVEQGRLDDDDVPVYIFFCLSWLG